MVNTYASEGATLKPCKLDDATLGSIGRLVRACAELEDLVTLYICVLAGISASKAIILLGRTAITRRVEIAEYLATMLGPHVVDLHKQCFTAGYWEALSCRNAVAHGVLMGQDECGRFAFLTAITQPTETSSAIQVVASYLSSDIKYFADVAEASVPQIEKILKLEPLRAERLARPLLPHRKGQPRPEKGERRKRPPPPPQA